MGILKKVVNSVEMRQIISAGIYKSNFTEIVVYHVSCTISSNVMFRWRKIDKSKAITEGPKKWDGSDEEFWKNVKVSWRSTTPPRVSANHECQGRCAKFLFGSPRII